MSRCCFSSLFLKQTRLPALQSSVLHIHSSNHAIIDHIRHGDLDSARTLFDAITNKTTISWNSMLAAYTYQPGHLHHALQLFAKMPQPDVVSYNTLLSCYFLNNETGAARVLFRAMPVKDVASWNTMISGLCRNGLLDDARKVFDEMPHRNAVSWNAIVSGCIKAGDLCLAEEYFSQAPHKNDLVLQTAMIAGYMGVGEIQVALNMFDEMPVRNSVTWNAVIAGFVENGRSEDGLKLFRRMLDKMEMEALAGGDLFQKVIEAYSRPTRILRGKDIGTDVEVSEAAFESDEERALWSAYLAVESEIHPGVDIGVFLNISSQLSQPLEDFFEHVYVMAEDERIRKNRLALLKKIADLPKGIADLSLLPGF